MRKTMKSIYRDSKTAKEIDELCHKTLQNSAYAFIDDLILGRIDRRELLSRGVVKGIENLERALMEKKGAILVSGHFSGNRVANRFLRELGFPVMRVRQKYSPGPSISVVAKKYCAPRITDILNKSFGDYVFIEDKDFVLEIMRRLRQNGLVGILYDAISRSHGISLSLFEGRRSFPSNFIEMARLTGAAIIPVLCIGNSSSFEILFYEKLELIYYPDKKEFLTVNLNALVRLLESQISQYPGHWLVM